LKEQLIELLTILFNRDNKAITDIIKKFDYKEEDYTRPPENIEKTVDTLFQMEQPEINCEFSHGHQWSEEGKSNGLNIPKDTIELWFKFNDVKLKRRKIYRFGDYYVRLLNTGFDKWDFLFYVKTPQIDGETIITNFTLAQHPHISHGRACFAQMESGIRASITNYNFNGFLWRMRTFLSSWNYRSPHYSPESFEYRNMRVFNNQSRKVMLDRINEGYRAFNSSLHTLNQHNIEFEIKQLMLPSARKKVYIKEPISRLFHQISNGLKYITGENTPCQRLGGSYIILNAITDWIKERMHNSQHYSDNDYVILANHLFHKLYTQCKQSISNEVEGEWIDDYNIMQSNWYKTTELCNHYRHKINSSPGRYGSHIESYLWYITVEKDNPDSFLVCQDLINELNSIRDSVQILRERITGSSGPSHTEISNVFYFQLAGIFKDLDEIDFENDSEFIKFTNNYTVDMSIESEKLADKMKSYNDRYLEIRDILTTEYNKQVIKYHETELRRLNGKQRKNTVQIETLNL